MTDDKTSFELEVVQRLTRIETKMDIQNGTVKKVCSDVGLLQDKDLVRDAQWSLMKKLSAVAVGVVGLAATVIPILVYIKVI